MFHNSVISLKRLYYGNRGEPINYGEHRLLFVPGTRPVRLKYLDSPNGTVRNDAKQIKFFLDQVKPGDFVLDIGGNVGQYAVLFASLVTERGSVTSFEPDDSSRALLKKNLALNGFDGRVTVEEIALSDTAGECAFFSTGTADANASFLDPRNGNGSTIRYVDEKLVRTKTVDDYLSSRNLPCPDWIKLDTEGAEINILRGARETLTAGARIACELHPYAWPEFSTTFEELLDIVRGCGRTIRYLDDAQNINEGALYGVALIL
jgi:FkbM family methyltransferase